MPETVAAHVLEDIAFKPNVQGLLNRLHIKPESSRASELDQLLAEARELAHPRAMYQVAYITARGENWVEIEGQRFDSRVLQGNLEPLHRVFPYLATCGIELQTWAQGKDDMLINYWAEAIKEEALYNALHALGEALDARYHPGKTASMNPGSLQDWPIQQQRMLFRLFGLEQERVGVQLTETMLMIPTKSVSGIRFATEVDFESCQLCPREGCPGRRAVYDPDLYERRFCLQNN